jgi:tripartite-type tricarboxylate transporter receptor subunit TctC
MMNKLLLNVATAVTIGAVAISASAQQYPVKPVKMVIGFPPGGGTDIVGRVVAQKLSEELGRQVIPDNRGGASGQIGTDLVAHATPDGYTMLMAHIAAVSILPSLVKLPYDPAKDLTPVSLVAIAPNLLVVHPSLRVTSVKDLVQLSKARPGQLVFASPGSGSVQHLAGELFKLQGKVDMLHVPYKGSGQSIGDLVSGYVQLNFDTIPTVISHVKSGKLQALAVTSDKRFELLPNVPTVSEGGLRGFDMSTWWGIMMPAGVDKDIIGKLHASTVKVLRTAETKQAMANVGASVVGNSPEEFAKFIREERTKYAKIVRDANIKMD